jgi:precorrin-6B methylase 2
MQYAVRSIKSFASFYYFLRFKLAMVKAAYYDWKLGIETDGYNLTVGQDISFYGDMESYSVTFYGRLQKAVKYLKLTPDDVFVDLGCGKGRVVFFIATHTLKKVIGVELDKGLFINAQKNLTNLKVKRTPVTFFNTDAAKFDLSEASIIYMFNPFGYKTVEKTMQNLKKSLDETPRKIRIVYYAPTHKDLLDSQDWLVREGQVEDENCLVWCNKLP